MYNKLTLKGEFYMGFFNKKSESSSVNNLKVFNIEDYQEEKLVLEKEQLSKERKNCKFGSIVAFSTAVLYGGSEAALSCIYDAEYPLGAFIVTGISLAAGIYFAKSIPTLSNQINVLEEKIQYAQKIKRR